jgi:hypothetical protein
VVHLVHRGDDWWFDSGRGPRALPDLRLQRRRRPGRADLVARDWPRLRITLLTPRDGPDFLATPGTLSNTDVHAPDMPILMLLLRLTQRLTVAPVDRPGRRAELDRLAGHVHDA